MSWLTNRSKINPATEEKVFCIGMNKTGTTSLEKALAQLGYRMGDQARGEMLIDAFLERRFSEITTFCYTADAFQDVPFSCPFLYVALDQHFSNAKFILSVRDTPEQWCNSLVKFHSKIYGGGKVAVKEDLQQSDYRYKGFSWKANRAMFDTPEDDIYNKELLIAHYEQYNNGVQRYFRFKKNLLVVNVSKKEDYLAMCAFLGKSPHGDDFPKLNVTSEL